MIWIRILARTYALTYQSKVPSSPLGSRFFDMTRIHLLSCLAIFLIPTAYAGPQSVISGKPMSSETAHQVGLGWPSIYYEWWNKGNPDWALAPELVYGDWSGEFSNVDVGAGFSVPLRWRLKTSEKADVALRFSPGVLIADADGPGDRFVFGARGEFGIPVSIDLHEKVNLITGGAVPATFIKAKNVDPYVVVPILGQIGVEVAATPTIVPWFLLQLGPALAFGDFGTEIELGMRAWIGSTFF